MQIFLITMRKKLKNVRIMFIQATIYSIQYKYIILSVCKSDKIFDLIKKSLYN